MIAVGDIAIYLLIYLCTCFILQVNATLHAARTSDATDARTSAFANLDTDERRVASAREVS